MRPSIICAKCGRATSNFQIWYAPPQERPIVICHNDDNSCAPDHDANSQMRASIQNDGAPFSLQSINDALGLPAQRIECVA